MAAGAVLLRSSIRYEREVMGQLREGKKSIADIHLDFARDGEIVEPPAAPARAGSPRHDSKAPVTDPLPRGRQITGG
jgi:hypothetical protein